jgi:NAD(P)H-quinone oxidoreductase subunit 5
MTHLPLGQLIREGAALAVPIVLAAGAALRRPAQPFASARTATALAFALSLCASALALSSPGTLRTLPTERVLFDAVSVAFLPLVCGIGLVVSVYARRSLAGDPGSARFVRWLLATLAGVSMVVVSPNLLTMCIAWVSTSLCLHPLLTFYAERRGALRAAHKKFVASRVAEVCLAVALGLLMHHAGTLDVRALSSWAAEHPELPIGVQAGLVLIVCAVVLKTAQVPFHGWLTQVMEAPTPVSALLHAGVVNLGGVLMIRLAPVLAEAPLARGLLLAVGLATALIATLSRLAQSSVKVSLAWSTSAQLGVMLAECALGLVPMALLHLVGHSLYKAHAFLVAGSATHGARVRALVRSDYALSARSSLLLAAQLGLAAASYLALHHVLRDTLPAAAAPATWLGASAGVLVVLAAAEHALVRWAKAPIAQRCVPALSAGLYIDDVLSRWLFRVWPPAPACPRPEPVVHPSAEKQEA